MDPSGKEIGGLAMLDSIGVRGPNLKLEVDKDGKTRVEGMTPALAP